MNSRLLSFTLLLGAALPACAQADHWSQTFEVHDHPTVTLRTDDAQVMLRSCDCRQVQAAVFWDGYKADQVRITPHQSGDHVSLDVRTHVYEFGLSFGLRHRSLRVELTMPRELNLEVEAGDGRVEAQGFKGDLHFRTSDGHLELSDMDGRLDARSSDGRMHIDGRFDSLRLQSSDGSIDLEARQGSQIASEWSIRTSDGSVHMRLPQDFKANLQAHTGDGHFHSDLPVEVTGDLREGRHQIEGRINGGGGALLIRTSDGSVTLERL